MSELRWKAAIGLDEVLHEQEDASARASRATEAAAWALAHVPELTLLGFGMLLRLAALRSYPVELGYDFWEHQQTVRWWSTHFAMPPFMLSRGSYHPQLYYAICGLLLRLGGSWQLLQLLSELTGCARLGLTWWAVERYLPQSRAARLSALALAAGLPVSVQMDAMMTQEPLNNLASLGFAVGLMELCRATPARRFRAGITLGAITGLGLLTKVSNLALLGVLATAALLELVQRRDLDAGTRVARIKPWLAAIAVAMALAAPQYGYNKIVQGKAFVDGWYRRPTEDTNRAAAHRKELLDRRTLGFVFGFGTDIVRFPYSPAGVAPTPRFWSALIATSYCDHFNYRFGPAKDAGGTFQVRGNGVGGRITRWAQASVASGVGIAATVILAWLVTMVGTLRRGEVARPAVLMMPALGLCGALFFAIQYPYDFEGVVKGHYFHFVSPPLYALFGASVGWLLRRSLTTPLAAVCAALTVAPAVYSALCVLR